MGDVYYKEGVSAGRRGSDSSPPKHNLLDSLTGIGGKAIEKMADDYYKRGYAAGSNQRVADEMRKNK